MNNVFKFFLIFFAGLLVFACNSDDDATTPTPPTDDGIDPPMDGTDPPQEEEPLFLFSSLLRSPSGDVTTIGLSEDLTETPDLSDTRNLEFPARADIFGVNGAGYFFVHTGEGIVTRYDLNENDEIVEGESLSFAGEGITSIVTQSTIVLNEEKAYIIPASSPQAVVWNPTTMTITGTVDYAQSEFLEDGFSFRQIVPTSDGQDIYVVLDYVNPDDALGTRLDGVYVTKIDTSTDQAVRISDPRAFSDGQWMGIAPNGDKLFFSHWDYAFITAGMDEPFNDYVFRIPSGSDAFDPDFQLSFSESTGIGRPVVAYGLLSNGDAVIQARVADAPEWEQTFDGPFFEYYIVRYPDYTEAVLQDQVPDSFFNSNRVIIDDDMFLTTFDSDFVARLWRFSADGVTRVLEIPEEQQILNVIRLR